MIDLDALAGALANSLQDPTYCVAGQVGGGEGFARFETQQTAAAGVDEVTIRVDLDLVSDGEDEVPFAPEVFEIVVRRVPQS